jgi:hypothetical protein
MKRTMLLMVGALVSFAGYGGVANNPIEFAARYDRAVLDAEGQRLIVADDFEQGVIKAATHDPLGNATGFKFETPAPRLRAMLAVVDPSGKAGLWIDEEQAASGAKSIRLQDAPSVLVDFTPALSWWFYGKDRPRTGRLRIAFDLLIPENGGGELHVITRDYAESRADKRKRGQQTHFTLACRAGGVRLGDARLTLTKGMWAHYQLELPLNDAGGKVKLTIIDSDLGELSVEQPLEAMARAVSLISLMLPGKDERHIFLDNLVITVTGN